MWYKINTRVVVLALLCVLTLNVYADAKDEREVDYLIDFVAGSDAIFVRNGSEHEAQEAADHLAMKYRRAGRYAKTAEDFIDNLASKSSITRKPYTIILSDGSEILARDWLYGALNDYRAQQATESLPGSAGH
ncbi:DUF5329 domain-containing protein [uncultured Gilvimarinus sp.]|uniref:DUF5329 domain-containing protein n=1 Tax=uncultured Gilvimarinus sp. TaxID=1689143 RepID=UPI0030EBCA72|tara:strand:+ start:697 stop:1095 length:399 start_codon:yes stop_codon:yes gene_type:complete